MRGFIYGAIAGVAVSTGVFIVSINARKSKEISNITSELNRLNKEKEEAYKEELDIETYIEEHKECIDSHELNKLLDKKRKLEVQTILITKEEAMLIARRKQIEA